MLNSIREEIYLSYLDYETSERVIWLFNWPGMVVLCVSQIYWSLEVENCLIDHAVFALELLHEKLKAQILKLVDLVRGWFYILYLHIIFMYNIKCYMSDVIYI
jgi:dynein heavy chain